MKALVVAWPLVQMLVTTSTPLSSWKLAGWGMYAEPHHTTRGIVVIDAGGARLVHMAWWESEAATGHARAFERFALLGSAGAAAQIVKELGRAAETTLVVLALPHADPRAREAWHEIVPFAVLGKLVVRLPSWSTRGMDAATVETRLDTDRREALERLRGKATKGEEA